MLSKRFMTWFGVGVLSVATIPTFAAPHLARLAARKPAAKTTLAAKPAAPKKTVAKPTALAKKDGASAAATKKAAGQHAAKTVSHPRPAQKVAPAKKQATSLAQKPAKAHKALAAAPHQPTGSAKKMLH